MVRGAGITEWPLIRGRSLLRTSFPPDAIGTSALQLHTPSPEQAEPTPNSSLPAFFALNVLLFLTAVLEIERDFYTQVDWSSFIQFVCQSFTFAYYGLAISLYTEQIWKASAAFHSVS